MGNAFRHLCEIFFAVKPEHGIHRTVFRAEQCKRAVKIGHFHDIDIQSGFMLHMQTGLSVSGRSDNFLISLLHACASPF